MRSHAADNDPPHPDQPPRTGRARTRNALASSGAVVDGLNHELDDWREDNETGVELEPWLDALDEYLHARNDPSPVEGWADLWPALPVAPEVDGRPEHGNRGRS